MDWDRQASGCDYSGLEMMAFLNHDIVAAEHVLASLTKIADRVCRRLLCSPRMPSDPPIYMVAITEMSVYRHS